ncbi:hypothetical protein P3C94_06880 [Pseudomonas aeruginosa]|uniref:hypothetical protein n=1 Tax=Pseudomonas aeruginosa TaxID=287 RepID=UPI000FC4267E|nr:hypothetical protein IPC1427_25770 [Pseudomonas aeruginosa]RUB65947.1 hypothetical protein IPC1428_26945 [Pseudomonas aeruginosa]
MYGVGSKSCGAYLDAADDPVESLAYTGFFSGYATYILIRLWMCQHGALDEVFIGCVVLAAIWLTDAVTIRQPPYVMRNGPEFRSVRKPFRRATKKRRFK